MDHRVKSIQHPHLSTVYSIRFFEERNYRSYSLALSSRKYVILHRVCRTFCAAVFNETIYTEQFIVLELRTVRQREAGLGAATISTDV